jgi:hypothetical protein
MAELCSHCRQRLQGIFYTCKLGERLLSRPDQMLDELDAVKARLAAACDLVSIESVQLSANRQELLILGVTQRGLARTQRLAGVMRRRTHVI